MLAVQAALTIVAGAGPHAELASPGPSGFVMGTSIAFLTDPCGTSIELTENPAPPK